MALKKNSNSLDNEQEKSQNDDFLSLELKNIENKTKIESQPLEVSNGNDNVNGFIRVELSHDHMKAVRAQIDDRDGFFGVHISFGRRSPTNRH